MLAMMLTLLSSVVLMGLVRQFVRNRTRLRQTDPYGRSPHHIPMSARHLGHSAGRISRPAQRAGTGRFLALPGWRWISRFSLGLRSTVSERSQRSREPLHTPQNSGPSAWSQLQPQHAVRIGRRGHDDTQQRQKAEPTVIRRIPH